MIRGLAVTAAGALAAWLMVGTGFANYDTAYSLLWGADLAAGRMPDYSVPVAPTPHPLATLMGLVLSPLGDRAEDAAVVLAFLALGALGWVVWALGREFFGPVAGAVAALIVLTREPVLSFGVRAYLDVPYVALVLAALLVEARNIRGRSRSMKEDGAASYTGTEPLHEAGRSRSMKEDGAASYSGTEPLHEAGRSWFMKRDGAAAVLVLLGLAGLLRPEAWLFAAAYVAWRRAWRLVPLAAAAPLVWMAFDWALAGDPLYSLTGTRDNAQVLQRRTGLDEVPLTVPRRLGEILREPVLLGAVIGAAMLFATRRRSALLPAAAGAVALAAFCVLAAAGLPILGRYLLLPAAILALFCGAAVAAWRTPGPWRAGAAVTVLALIAFTPKQVERIDRLHGAIGIQREIRDDLHAIAPAARCRPIGVPNHRAVPLLALWLDARPSEIVSAQLERLDRGTFLAPATPRVERNFILDRNDPGDLRAEPPASFAEVARNRSWVLLARC